MYADAAPPTPSLLACPATELNAALAALLELFGCSVTNTASLRDAREHVHAHPEARFAVALLDIGIGMPADELEPLLASPVLRGATVVLATTLPADLIAPLPDRGVAKRVCLLEMPFNIVVLEEIILHLHNPVYEGGITAAASDLAQQPGSTTGSPVIKPALPLPRIPHSC